MGFLAAGLGLIGWQSGTWSLVVPLLVFSPFIVDASVTLAKRMARGEKFWQAHRTHYYQRLVLSGWSHRKTAVAEYGMMIVCGLCALAFQAATDGLRLVIIGGLGALFVAMGWWVAAVEHKAVGREVLIGP